MNVKYERIMIYGIVGNRKGWNKEFVLSILRKQGIKEDDTIISGGASGVDSWAEEFAKEIGCKLIVHKPDENLLIPERYYQRNRKIAKECDVLIAFDKKIHSGTSQTCRMAKDLGKIVKVFFDEEIVKIAMEHRITLRELAKH